MVVKICDPEPRIWPKTRLNMRSQVKIQCKLVNITLGVKTLWGLLNTCDPQRDLKTWLKRRPKMWSQRRFSEIESDYQKMHCLFDKSRLFEDNADTDTWNTSKPQKCAITKHQTPGRGRSWQNGPSSRKLVSGKMSVRVSGGLFEASCIESGWEGELALNSCCAHCDKIERGIERNRRHNKPVFRPAEPAPPTEQLLEPDDI